MHFVRNLDAGFTEDWIEIHHRMHAKPLSHGIPMQCCPSLIGNSCSFWSRLPRILEQVLDYALLYVYFVFSDTSCHEDQLYGLLLSQLDMLFTLKEGRVKHKK